MKEKYRINKWRKYRENIDKNESIHFSIVNSDPELLELFKSINFNVEESYSKAGYKTKSNDINHKSNEWVKIQKELENILSTIERNETIENNKKIKKDFNSHKFDDLINEHFPEFIDKQINKEDQETTDLKINKINIIEKK